jgi:hypothetical protein
MSEGYYAHKARRARLVEEAEALGISTDQLGNNDLAWAISVAKREPVRQELDDSVRVERVGHRDRLAAQRLVARSSRGRFADPGGYANPREAFNDLYGEVS